MEIVATKTIDLENVHKVYSGRPGCMCGCNGDYKYPSNCDRSGKDRGYKITDDEISDRSVKLLVNKFNKLILQNSGIVKTYEDKKGSHLIYFVDTDTRMNVVYLKK